MTGLCHFNMTASRQPSTTAPFHSESAPIILSPPVILRQVPCRRISSGPPLLCFMEQQGFPRIPPPRSIRPPSLDSTRNIVLSAKKPPNRGHNASFGPRVRKNATKSRTQRKFGPPVRKNATKSLTEHREQTEESLPAWRTGEANVTVGHDCPWMQIVMNEHFTQLPPSQIDQR